MRATRKTENGFSPASRKLLGSALMKFRAKIPAFRATNINLSRLSNRAIGADGGFDFYNRPWRERFHAATCYSRVDADTPRDLVMTYHEIHYSIFRVYCAENILIAESRAVISSAQYVSLEKETEVKMRIRIKAE